MNSAVVAATAAIGFLAAAPAFADNTVIGSYHAGCMQGGGSVSIAPCNSASAAQQFQFSGYGQIQQGSACLTGDGQFAKDGKTPVGTPLTMKPCDTKNKNQKWAFNGRQLNNEGGWCADIKGAGRGSGTPVIAWTCTGRSNQQWGKVVTRPASNVRNMTPAATKALQTAPAGSVIELNSGRVVSQGGGNVVSQGGGNIVSHDGGTVVAAGGGNVVSQGGGN